MDTGHQFAHPQPDAIILAERQRRQRQRAKELRCVVAALRTYCLLCTMDLAFLLLTALLPRTTGRLVLNW